MKHPFKGVGSFIVFAAIAYLVLHYWPVIKAAMAPALKGSSPSGTNTVDLTHPAPGDTGFDPAFDAIFGGGTSTEVTGASISPNAMGAGGKVQCFIQSGGPLGGAITSCGQVSLGPPGIHPPLLE